MTSFAHELNSRPKPSWLREKWWDISDKISDFLLDHKIFIHWRIRDAIHYIKNRFRQSHLIDTKLDKGHWIDKVRLMEAGLLELVDSFVSRDGEDAFSVVVWDDGEEHETMKFMMIEILYWKHVRSPALEKEKDDLWETYHNKYPLRFVPIPEREGCSELVHENNEDPVKRNEELTEILNKERFIESETQRILHLCVDVREYLWT